MSYLSDLLTTQDQQLQLTRINQEKLMGLTSNEAYAQYFPTWEVTTPQYQTPVAWSLAQLGYRTNEVAYACIDLKMNSVAEPAVEIWDKVEEKVIDNDEFSNFMNEPCPGLSQTDFWKACEMYLNIAGILAWEKNMANDGSLLNVWPMMPQYCSYMRGQGKLLDRIRYLPYTGLPALDIMRDRMIVFAYTDPWYFGLKPFSPTMVLADIIGVDNDMTKLIQSFLTNGTFADGMLKTEQVINNADATFARERWQEAHGGVTNAGKIAVMGKGLEWVRSGSTFREMVFPEVDARNETRICMGYKVPPILVSAKSGMDRATYSNYEQARKAWYEEFVTSEWKFLAECATRDLLPHFDDNPNHILRFDTKGVKALQEDRTSTWTRATTAYKDRVIVRNDALVEMGLNPLEEGDPLGLEYYQTAMVQTSTSIQDDLDKPNIEKKSKSDVEVTGQDLVKVSDEDKQQEEKQFRAFAKRRIKENKSSDISEYEFKYLDEKKQRKLLSEFNVPDPDAQTVLQGLVDTVKAIHMQSMIVQEQKSINVMMSAQEPPIVNITNQIPEQKSIDIPTPIINVEVNPTPIENKIEVTTPKVKSSVTTKKVKRDSGNNIDGMVDKTEYEYDE